MRLNRVKRVETDAFGEVSNEDEVMGRVIRDYDLFFFLSRFVSLSRIDRWYRLGNFEENNLLDSAILM